MARGRGDNVDTFWKGCPQQNLGGQKRLKFGAIFHNRSQISLEWIHRAEINCNPSLIERKKLGELWSTNKKVMSTRVNPPKWTLFRRLNFRPNWGCWLLKFLHALEIDQGCLAHTPNWDGVPQKFTREHSKISLKFITKVSITLGLVAIIL